MNEHVCGSLVIARSRLSLSLRVRVTARRQLRLHWRSAQACGPGSSDQDLFKWLITRGARCPDDLKLAVSSVAGQAGRGVVAVSDCAAGEELLSIPSALTFVEQATEEGEGWSVPLQILRERAKGARGMRPWIDALPPTAPQHFAAAAVDLDLVQDAALSEEVQALQQWLQLHTQEHAAELAELGCGAEDYAWAFSMFHSRKFAVPLGQRHLVVTPGIDMINHSFEPNAHISYHVKTDMSQGRDALEDVCDYSKLPPGDPSTFFTIKAGEAGISAGAEVTISYGPFPNELFLPYFGFLPGDNPCDTVILFDDLPDLVAFHNTLARIPTQDARQGGVDDLLEWVKALSERLRQETGVGDWRRLSVTPEGVQGRLMVALRSLQELCRQRGLPVLVSEGAVIVERCKRLQEQLSRRLGTSSGSTAICGVARIYVQHKWAILQKLLGIARG